MYGLRLESETNFLNYGHFGTYQISNYGKTRSRFIQNNYVKSNLEKQLYRIIIINYSTRKQKNHS